jgi:hypothetical protein
MNAVTVANLAVCCCARIGKHTFLTNVGVKWFSSGILEFSRAQCASPNCRSLIPCKFPTFFTELRKMLELLIRVVLSCEGALIT